MVSSRDRGTGFYHHSDRNVALRTDPDKITDDSMFIVNELFRACQDNPHALNRVDNFIRFVDSVGRSMQSILFVFIHNENLTWDIPPTQRGKVLVELLVDTLKFLLTGQRDFPLTVYMSTASAHATDHEVLTSKELSEFKDLLATYAEYLEEVKRKVVGSSQRTVSYINMWCEHTGGFKDMIQTLFLIHKLGDMTR